MALEVSDRDGERVGSVGARHAGEPEDHPNHLCDLDLVGPTLTRDRALDARRRVFEGVHTRPRADEERDPSSVTELRCSRGVLREEERLDARDVRAMLLEDVDEARLDGHEALSKIALVLHVEDAMGHVHETRAVLRDDSPPEVPSARIEAEDDHVLIMTACGGFGS